MEKTATNYFVLPEQGYEEAMQSTVEPYLAARRTDGFCQREEGKRIFYARCLADSPRGVVVISHGYTETIEKYLENIFYFLRQGYHVFMPEHCGHGRSYRVYAGKEDLCLVYVDDYQRYVEDLLLICRMAAREFPELPLFLYGHSMGGGVAAAAAAQAPELLSGLILSSPMIRPNSGSVPWVLARLMAGVFCLAGKKGQYLMGHHPYDGKEQFAESAGGSEARFRYYKEKRDREPLFQMSGASYGWTWQTARLNRYLQKEAAKRIICPVIVLQAELDTYVSNAEQEKFIEKLNKSGGGNATLVRIEGVKHEIFNAETTRAEQYWEEVFSFLGKCVEKG
ncbi:MAG: alpha/beta hydrolase [Roseburia sp.]|nr:alpha/beta hydrolase [Roseburia sp.]